jgi:tetrahydromethanopterin S-methyltransferase subunit G
LNNKFKEESVKKIMIDTKIIAKYKKFLKDNLELKIDFTFGQLIDKTDEIEKREINNIYNLL